MADKKQLSFFGGMEGEEALRQMQENKGGISAQDLLKNAQWSVLINHTGVYGVLKAGPIQFTGGILWDQIFQGAKEVGDGGQSG